MLDDRRLDSKLAELARELVTRPFVPRYGIADAFTMRGIDESGKPGVFAAVLLHAVPAPELDTLTTFRAMLAARLKQLDTTMPAWPIVVQGAPELINGEPVVPGGREYFEQLRSELQARRDRMVAVVPAITVEASGAENARGAKVRRVKKNKAVARRTVARAARASARTSRTARSAKKARR
jgi:hypothetical protein